MEEEKVIAIKNMKIDSFSMKNNGDGTYKVEYVGIPFTDKDKTIKGNIVFKKVEVEFGNVSGFQIPVPVKYTSTPDENGNYWKMILPDDKTIL